MHAEEQAQAVRAVFEKLGLTGVLKLGSISQSHFCTRIGDCLAKSGLLPDWRNLLPEKLLSKDEHERAIALGYSNLPADEAYESKPETEEVRPAMQEGEPCRKCSTPVIKQTPRKKPKHDYYYEYYLLCPKCQTSYTVEQAKRFTEQPLSLF